MRAALVLAVVFAVGLGAEREASAQKWAEGVSDTQKAEAKKNLDDGNTFFLKQDYKTALEKYQAAIKAWDHPAIRFNVVRCLIQLDRPVEASDNLQAALKYGAEPLEEAVYQEALSYQKLLANQIGEIEVSCKQDGAKLTFDGQSFIDKCPGTEKRRVAPGQHSVVATKEGFLTKEMPVIVIGGKQQSVNVELVPLDKAAKVVHRWPTWIPWVVFGGGLAVAGFGVLVELDARDRMNEYDQRVASSCAVNGCNDAMLTELGLKDARQSAETRDKIAISVISVGAVGAAIGGVLLFMNRGKTVYEDPVKQPMVNVSPTKDGGGIVTISGGF